MTAETIARALGGRKAGRGWMARCPAHGDREPSLSIREADGKVLVRCHAGCDQRDVIAALKERGLWDGKATSHIHRLSCRKIPESQPKQQHEERSAAALAIWQSTIPAVGTPVETYLSARGLDLSLPPSLRFHRGLKHPSGGFWPCMVALITRGADNAPTAIHRTFLARNGGGKAPVDPAKMMLGPCRGGAVRFSQPTDTADGWAKALRPASRPCRQRETPPGRRCPPPGCGRSICPTSLREVIVLADGDDPWRSRCPRLRHGLATGRTLRVRIARPPRGQDFNDMLDRHTHPSKREGLGNDKGQ